jgi:N-acetylneuraminic acid mutarotase
MSRPCLLTAATSAALLLSACREDAAAPTEPDIELATAASSWATRADLWSNQYAQFTAAAVPNASGQSVLYVMGGLSATGGSLSKVMAYDVVTNRWTVKAPLPVALRRTNGAGVIGGKIYISGGQSAYKYYRSDLYVYDPAANTWSRRRDMPTQGYDGLTGVIENKLYVVTGCHSQYEDCGPYPPGDHPDRWLFRYDPATDAWTELAIPPFFYQPVGGTIGGKLYLFSASNVAHVYDPATDTWTDRATSLTVPEGAVSATLGGKLYVFGGNRINPDYSATPLRTTSVYDPATNLWTSRARMPTGRAGGMASRVVVNGQARIEVVAGSRPGNNLQFIP